MKMKKALKIIGIILAIVLFITIIHMVRNFIIIKDLQNKISKYKDTDNVHLSLFSDQHNGTVLTCEYYKKDGKKAAFIERNVNGKINKLSIYEYGDTHHSYTEAEDVKVAKLNAGFISVEIFNGTEMETFFQTILSSLVSNIKTVKMDGKEYYELKHTLSPMLMEEDNQSLLVDKETGLLYKKTSDISTSTRKYEFDNVDDSIFIEPDISEYSVQE